MKVVVLDALSLGKDLDLSPLSRFGEVMVYDASTGEEAMERLRDCEVAVLNKVRLSRDILENAKRLRLICETATGYDNIDLAACRMLGIAVTNVAGYSTNSVAQLTAAMALSAVTRLPEYTCYVRDGSYTASGIPNLLSPVYHEISGMTWGILGYGNIGRAVGRVARALGCHVIACKRTPTDECETVRLSELCRRSDILSVHVPLSDETRGLLSREMLSLLKPSAVLINVARGAVIDEDAAADALLSGRLGAFCSDVYSREPFSPESAYARIQTHPRAILTPHMAWGGYETRVRLLSKIVKNIESFLKGDRRSRVD